MCKDGKRAIGMKIGLAVYEFKNNDPAFNISQIEKAMSGLRGSVDLLCFGECFLQGFDSLVWDYERDKNVAVSANSETMERLCGLTLKYGVDLLIGYMERSGEKIYSSCALIEKGKLVHNYRRISKGWKEYTITDEHYCEGSETDEISYRGRIFGIALCGDLWDYPEKFKTTGVLIWPIYVNFGENDWAGYEAEYAQQAGLAAEKTLLVNSVSHDPDAIGGAFCFENGRIKDRLSYGTEGVLTVDI